MKEIFKRPCDVLAGWITRCRQITYLNRIDRAFNKAIHHWTQADIYKAMADSLIEEYNFLFPDDQIGGDAE